MQTKIIAKDKEALDALIKEEMLKHGNQCNLNHIDVSGVIDMSYMFRDSPFNGDISNWNVSDVVNMKGIS